MNDSSHRALFSKKRIRAEDCIQFIKAGDTLVIPTGVGEPPELLQALSAQRHQLHDVKVSQILPLRTFDYLDASTVAHVRPVSYFHGAPSRPGTYLGPADSIPCHFSEIPLMIERGLLPADVVFALASPMDAHGYFSISLGTDYTMAAIERARAVVLEVNPNVPFTYGNCHVHISRVSAVLESDLPLKEVGLPAIGPVQQTIGQYVADMIEDNSTLQIGYGGIPDAVVMQLKHKKNLGIHTEMLGDGILSLVHAGAVTNDAKNFMRGKMVATFALGSKALYQFMDRNPMLEMHPSNFTNDPYIASQNDKLISINATLQIDLIGQCGSESFGPRAHSGTGGQADFVRAANRSKGGRSFIVVPSTAKDDTISRIVPTLTPGTHISTSKNDVDCVVTEYGVARLRGQSARQRAQALINIAHPKFRDELRFTAEKIGVL